MKTKRQTNSIDSVTPHGGSKRGEPCLASEETDSDDGRSTKASDNTSAIVMPKTLVDRRGILNFQLSLVC